MSPQEAQTILQALVIGVDPETGEILSETSPFNNIKVVRALHLAMQAIGSKVPKTRWGPCPTDMTRDTPGRSTSCAAERNTRGMSPMQSVRALNCFGYGREMERPLSFSATMNSSHRSPSVLLGFQ